MEPSVLTNPSGTVIHIKPDYSKLKSISSKSSSSQLSPIKPKYFDCYCFQIRVGGFFTYLFLFISLVLMVINRIIWVNYKFRFNFAFLSMQQFINLLIYTLIGNRSQIFIKEAGKVSFSDFYKHKFFYITFSMVFSLNYIINFYANQVTENINMYMSFRKLTTPTLMLIDLIIYRKKPTISTMVSVVFITTGSFLVAMDGFSRDYIGVFIVMINNFFTILYLKISDSFKKKTGVSNLKLLAYNSYLINITMISSCFVSGEYKKLYEYFTNIENIGIEGSLKGLIWYLFLSCFFCFILNSSYFISNEKNSSLITEVLNNSKSVLITAFFYFYDRNRNNVTWKMFFGIIISTIGALTSTLESILNTFIFGVKAKPGKKNNRKEDKEQQGKELEEQINTKIK